MPDNASRLHFIDWLRVLAVLLLFPFHVLRVFNAGEDFYVKADVLSQAVTDVLWFISVWHMPLLFFLAGCSTYYALRKRSAGEYAWERVKRLLVPLVFGIFILIPPQTWYGARFNSGYEESYGHYLVSGDFLRWNVQDGGDYYGGFGIGQLWFILFLLIISLVLLPLVVWAARGRGTGWARRWSARLARPAWWILPVVLLFIGDAAPEVAGMGLVYYLVIFGLGFFAMCDRLFMEAAERFRWPTLAVGIALSLFWVLGDGIRNPLPDPSWQRVLLTLLGFAAVWLTILGMMGFGKRRLERPSRPLAYLSEASYPLYILHQTVIVVLAFYVVQWALPGGMQAVLLFVLAVAGTFALYEIVRRIGPLRFLLGMRVRRKRTPSPMAQPTSGP